MKHFRFFSLAAGVALVAMIVSCGPKKLSDRQILELIYNSTGGPEWSEYNQDGWLVEEDLNDWHGVKVNEEGRVIELRLEQPKGIIPAEIGDLTELEKLYIYVKNSSSDGDPENPLPLTISKLAKLRSLEIYCGGVACQAPSLMEMPDLETLILTCDGSEYPEDIASRNLVTLRLCDFTGVLPAWIYEQPALEELYVYTSELKGGLAPEVGNLYNLTELHIDNSQFIGAVDAPDSDLPAAQIFDNLKSLKYLFLRRCSTSGVLPESIGDMPELKSMILCDLGLTGELPKQLGDLPKIETLEIYENELTGQIPPELFNATTLKSLWLQRNHLTGPLPKEIGNLVNLESIYIANNELSGTIPAEMSKCTKLGKGVFNDFSGNQFSPDIPAQVQAMERFSEFKF